MTHKQIFTKYMIEYDKANITSSYPSLTKYEIATVLDKAYLALIAQKLTGNNVRKAPFESDVKSVSDIQGLIVTITKKLDNGKDLNQFTKVKGYPYSDKDLYDDDLYTSEREYISIAGGQLRSMPDNVRSCSLPTDFLYFVSAGIPTDVQSYAGIMNEYSYSFEKGGAIKPMDNKQEDYKDFKLKRYRFTPVKLVNHQIAEKFFATAYNIPWIKNPVCYLEGNQLFVVADPIIGIPNLYYVQDIDGKPAENKLTISYRQPDENGNAVVYKDQQLSNGTLYSIMTNKNTLPIVKYNGEVVEPAEWISITYIKRPNLFVDTLDSDAEFELSDTIAEELISLAISYALENVESPRLNAHLGIRGLEG